jgi:hypothetical protein
MAAATTPKTFRLTPQDIKALASIRKRVGWLRTDTDALRYALASALDILQEINGRRK